LNVVYSARYRIDIGPHVFPTLKYSLIHAALLERGVSVPAACIEPEPATWEQLALVHTREYLDKMRHGTMTDEDVQQLELPWSSAMVEGFRLMTGGTVQAAELACLGTQSARNPLNQERISAGFAGSAFNVVCHIGGGLHHAFPSHGEGFCPFNDVAVAARVLQSRGIERLAIVDLDVHHGNGTAFTFESDRRVFTFSMHQQHNYPLFKPRGTLDIGLPDGTHDATYLRALERALPIVMAHAPPCVFYVAGADPYDDAQLGCLRLTQDGLRRRDRRVIEAGRPARTPLTTTLPAGSALRG